MSKTLSLLRLQQYKALAEITLHGSTLDLGGSRKSGYHELFQGDPTFTVVNIDEEYGYDLNFNIENPFPIASESYDNVIAINTLEHIYNFHNVIQESYRVMKPGGTFVSVTPFVFKVHGCPHDFFRYTKSSLERMLHDAGFHNVDIRETGCGICSCFYQNVCGVLLFNWLHKIVMFTCIQMDAGLEKISKRYKKLRPEFALGYIAVATK